jgi:glucokinase
VNSGAVVGIDIGGTKLLAVRIDGDGAVTVGPVQSSPQSGAELCRHVVECAQRLCGGQPDALGVGVAGLVDRSGRVRFAPNLQGIIGSSLGEALRTSLPDFPIWIGNDATAAAWGEYAFGLGSGSSTLVMVNLGTGIGGGLVYHGELYGGADGYAGEFGHMVVDPNGPRCPCGRRGCWERFASGPGLGWLGREAALTGQAPRLVELAGGDPESVRGEHVTIAATEGDGPATEVMARFAWWVALGLANLADALNPDLIVVGGGLAEAGEVLMAPTRRAFTELLGGQGQRPAVDIVVSALGPTGGAIGAGLLARRLLAAASSSPAPGPPARKPPGRPGGEH